MINKMEEEVSDYRSILNVRKAVLSLEVCGKCDAVFEETFSHGPEFHICDRCLKIAGSFKDQQPKTQKVKSDSRN
jgi:hypothetical protein